MKESVSKALKNYVLDFAKLYHEYKVRSEALKSVRYTIASSLAEYKRTNKICLSITDRAGDLLPNMTVSEIKKSPDIIAGMHPVDVNTINDLYYLAHDELSKIKVMEDKIIAFSKDGVIVEYDVNKPLNLDELISPRISYIIGQMQAEKAMRKLYKENNRYKILSDNIVSLHILDNQTNEKLMKRPTDILFSGEYNQYSKEDVVKIGYICGQMGGLNI